MDFPVGAKTQVYRFGLRMRWEEYKALCERYDHFSRFALETTRAVLGSGPLYESLGAVLEGEPIAQPDDHHGGPETDHYSLVLLESEVRSIIERLSAEVINTDDLSRGRLGHLCVVWEEYASFLSRPR
jgi:hypothetical protein